MNIKLQTYASLSLENQKLIDKTIELSLGEVYQSIDPKGIADLGSIIDSPISSQLADDGYLELKEAYAKIIKVGLSLTE